jgi:hypothetical protein
MVAQQYPANDFGGAGHKRENLTNPDNLGHKKLQILTEMNY